MAVIDKKRLIQQYEWRKLSPSARELLEAFATCTDKTGRGAPSWNGLMYFSGIQGRDTFKRARDQLLNCGLISFDKKWERVLVNGKRLPRAVITYQITETILWKKSPSGWDNSSNKGSNQSMGTESMDSGKEDVSSLGVTNIGVKEQKPSAVITYKKRENKNVKGFTSISGIITRSGSSFDRSFPNYPINHEWQEHAQRIAKYLNVDVEGDKEWFGLFKKAHQANQKTALDTAASFCVDYPDTHDMKRLFYWKFNQVLKGECQV